MFFFVIRHHRKRKKKTQRDTKKKRTAYKNKRKVRLPEDDVGHNVENHLNQSEIEEEVEEPDDEMGESNAAGAAIAGTATAATATRKGPAPAAEGEGAPLRPPIAKKRSQGFPQQGNLRFFRPFHFLKLVNLDLNLPILVL